MIANPQAERPAGSAPAEVTDDYAALQEHEACLQRLCDYLVRISDMEKMLHTNLLRNEANILLLIKREPGHPVKHYMNKCEMSHRGFWNILSSLLERGLVRYEHCSEDRRRRLLR